MQELQITPLDAFNPSLVRLALGAGVRATYIAGTFQSQLGPIGALITLSLSHSSHLLSIPAWFDWRISAPSAP